MSIFLSLLASILGGALALGGVYLNNKWTSQRLTQQFSHERSTKKSELLRERGEELYMLFDQWLIGLANYYLNISAVMQGKITYNDHYDLMKQNVSKEFNYGRIEMLIDVYFSSIRPAYDAVILARTNLNKIATNHKHSYERGCVDGAEYLSPFVGAQKSIEKLGDDAKRQIIEAIRAI